MMLSLVQAEATAVRWQKSFNRLCVAQISLHSEVTLNRPRKRNSTDGTSFFDLSENWFDRGFSKSVASFLLGWPGPLSCGLLLGCTVHWEAAALQVVVGWSQVKPRELNPLQRRIQQAGLVPIARICSDDLWSGLGGAAYTFYKRQQLLPIRGLSGQFGGHNDLSVRVNCDLDIVSLHKGFLPIVSHHPRIGIDKIVLTAR